MLKFTFNLKDQYGNSWWETVTVDGLRTVAQAEQYAVKWVTCKNAVMPMGEGPWTLLGHVRVLKSDMDDCLHHQWTQTSQEPNRQGSMRYHCRRCGVVELREPTLAPQPARLKKRL
jgi:hypothetical protein